MSTGPIGPGPVAPVAVPAIDEGSSLLSDYEQAEAGGEAPTANGGELHCSSAYGDIYCASAPAVLFEFGQQLANCNGLHSLLICSEEAAVQVLA